MTEIDWRRVYGDPMDEQLYVIWELTDEGWWP